MKRAADVAMTVLALILTLAYAALAVGGGLILADAIDPGTIGAWVIAPAVFALLALAGAYASFHTAKWGFHALGLRL